MSVFIFAAQKEEIKINHHRITYTFQNFYFLLALPGS